MLLLVLGQGDSLKAKSRPVVLTVVVQFSMALLGVKDHDVCKGLGGHKCD